MAKEKFNRDKPHCNIGSMRVGMTVKDVADVINPVADKARVVLGEK